MIPELGSFWRHERQAGVYWSNVSQDTTYQVVGYYDHIDSNDRAFPQVTIRDVVTGHVQGVCRYWFTGEKGWDLQFYPVNQSFCGGCEQYFIDPLDEHYLCHNCRGEPLQEQA